mgnify:CR=1 FL=1
MDHDDEKRREKNTICDFSRYNQMPYPDLITEFAPISELSSNLSTMGWKSDPRAPSPQLIPRPPPTFHDTRPEQAAAEQEIARQNAAALDDQVPVIPRLTQLQPPADRRDRPDSLYTPKADLALPDLVPAAKKLNNATRYQKQKPYR